MTEPKIRFDNVCKRYGPLTVLDGLNMEVATGELVTIVGPSGSGKTTVLRVLMTLETIEEGLISIDGEPFDKMRSGGELVPASSSHIRRIRAKIGMVFQNFNLFPHMTALGNCIEAPIYSLDLPRFATVSEIRFGATDMRHQPNILMLQVDQLSASALRAYGNRCSITPAIDRLAGAGVVFENAYTNFPVCASSRFSMMSGRLASAIEAYDNAAEFRASIPTMAHYLRHLDYHTALCGKMHFIGPDLLHGFEERLTPEIYSSDFMTLPDWSQSGRDDYASDAYEALAEAGPAPRTVQMDHDEEVAFQAKRKLYDLARTDDPRSFFLAVSFTHPHDPYICRQEFRDLFSGAEIDMPRVGRFAESDLDPHSRRIYRHYNLSRPEITDDHVGRARRAYYGSLAYVDRYLGELLDVARETGLLDDTIVLEADRLVDILPRRSPVVSGISTDEVLEISAIRLALEPLALGAAIPNMTGETIRAAEGLVEDYGKCSDPWDQVELNRQFHLGLYEPCGKQRLMKIISDQYDGMTRCAQVLVIESSKLVDRSVMEHEEILKACDAKDLERATAMLRAHLQASNDRLHRQLVHA